MSTSNELHLLVACRVAPGRLSPVDGLALGTYAFDAPERTPALLGSVHARVAKELTLIHPEHLALVAFKPATGEILGMSDASKVPGDPAAIEALAAAIGALRPLASADRLLPFEVEIEIKAEDGSRAPLGQVKVMARSNRDACTLARDLLWDERLTCAGCSARMEVRQIPF